MAGAPGLRLAIDEKRFAGSEALFTDFRLEVAPCEVVAVMGASGVGKSTLLRLVAGIARDFVGEIEVGTLAAADAPAPGFVFQDARLLPWLTVAENVRLAAPAAPEAEIAAHLGAVGLAGRDADYPGQLSGGMQRRVALARALAGGSGLWLFDEPFVSLDMALAADMQDLVARLIAATRPTVLLATHSAAEAVRLADRVVVLAGRPARIVADIPLDRADAVAEIKRIETLLGG